MKKGLLNFVVLVLTLISIAAPIVAIINVYYQYKFFKEYSENNENDRRTAVVLKNTNVALFSMIIATISICLLVAVVGMKTVSLKSYKSKKLFR